MAMVRFLVCLAAACSCAALLLAHPAQARVLGNGTLESLSVVPFVSTPSLPSPSPWIGLIIYAYACEICLISSLCGVLVSGLVGLDGHERPAAAGFLRVGSEVMVALKSAFDLHILFMFDEC
jgi:hypothetical protein